MVEEYAMVNGIKCGRLVEETEASDLFIAVGSDDGVVERKKNGFSGVKQDDLRC